MSSLDGNGGKTKIRERDTHNMMVTIFKDKDEDSDFSLRLVHSMDIQDNEEGGHHQHEGVVDEGKRQVK